MNLYARKNRKRFSRITLLTVLFFLLFIAIIFRLFCLQIIKHDYYTSWAEARHMAREEIKPDRGGIFVKELKNGQEKLTAVASNQQSYLLYGVPANITQVTSTIALIEKVLPMSDEDRWQTFLKLDQSDDPYEPIQHYVTQIQKNKLERIFVEADINKETLGFQKEVKRIYPQNNQFADVLGFLGYQGDQRVGQYGIEEYFEQELVGKGGIFKIEKDPKGRLIGFGENEMSEIVNGSDIILTLDPTVQFRVCEILESWRDKMAAEDGTVIVLNPSNGYILAMCDKPDFDLNNYNQVEDISIYFNKAVNEAYEPGSIFKPITMAAALDLERVTPETEYEDKGFLKFGSDTIHNAANKTYGRVNMTEVLENSINTGAVFAAMEIGHANLKKYVEDFGFGQQTGISLPVESAGNISSLNNSSEIYTATASYGQGIMTTPLQMIMAYGAIANGGMLMQPQIVAEIRQPDGSVEKFHAESAGQIVRRVISSKTSNVLKAMLTSVIKNGQAGRAGVDGYYVAGKTGTASIADPRGGYYEDQTHHTFIGFAPVDNAKFVVLVKLTKPKNVKFSSDSAAPAVGEIMEYLLHYYQIPPDF